MPQTIQQTANDYAIMIDPLSGLVTAHVDDILVASSNKAVVMYETRLSPVVYFPLKDVQVPVEASPSKKTFCPFKGTAEYFHLHLPEKQIENAIWTYHQPLLEGQGVKDHIAFMPNVLTKLDLGSNALKENFSGNITGPIVDWLMREAWLCQTPEELINTIANKLIADGVVISRMSVMIWSLHPMIAGRNFVWDRKTNQVETFTPSYDIHQHPSFVNSPLRHVSNGLGGVRQRLNAETREFNFPIMDELKAEGATDYVAMPLPFSNGQINVMTLTSDHEVGFTTPNLGLVFELAPVISRFFEVFTLKENAQTLLETYLGKRTGDRVLGGEIRRGDGDEIEAAILFCDLRDSTALEERLGRTAYIALLNQFFEITTDIVNRHGGEVLKFIGDAVLAIFPTHLDHKTACVSSQDAAMAIVDALNEFSNTEKNLKIDCAIGIAYGEVMYGNVGSKERLDFTVIGSAANVAARLGDWGKSRGHPIVATGDILSANKKAIALGEIELRNVADPISAYALSQSPV